MTYRVTYTAWLVLLMLVTLSPIVWGQTERGAITGTVTDSRGAVLPGATVTVTNIETNVSQTYTTNADGLYEAPFLTPGRYKVSATAPGFATAVKDRITVNVAARVRVDLTLQVGAVTEQVVVTVGEPLVQSETASIGQVIENKLVSDLPNADRNIYSFLLLNSNVTQPPGGNAPAFRLESGGSFSISGTRPSSITFKIDGLSNTDPTFGTPTITPSLDSVQEFKVQNNAYSAEYEGIGQVNVATKAGGNQFHGTLFEFLRNDALQPRNPIAPLDSRGRPRKDKLRFNQFGGTIGGPVWLPGLYKGTDKTFFFFSYEGRRSNTLGLGITSVPTAAERNGDFSANLGDCVTALRGGVNTPVPLLKPDGTPSGDCVRKGQIFDPATTVANPLFDPSQPASVFNPPHIRQPFAGNRIPASRINPLAQRLIAATLPLPNNPGIVEQNFLGTTGLIFSNNQYTTRIDHTFSDKDTLYGRLTIQNNIRITKPLIPFTAKNLNNKGRVFSMTWTHVFSSNAVNEFRLGYVRGIYGDSIDEIDPTQFGIRNTFMKTLPTMGVVNGFGGSVLATTQNTYQLADNFSLVSGRHALKVGFKGDHNRFQNGDLFGGNGTGRFTGIYTLHNPSIAALRENTIADFLLGLAQSTSLNTPTIANIRNTPWSLYVQDDWKVSDRVTMNLGLRYELHQPWKEQILGGSTFEMQGGGRLLVVNPELAKLANSPLVACCAKPRVVPTDKTDFGPRIGLAIRPFQDGKTVVRAGYGIFYADTTQFFHWRQYEPALRPVFTGTSGDFLRPGATLDNLFPSNLFVQSGISPFFPAGVPPAILDNQPVVGASALGSYRTPYSQQWSLSIQREVLPNMLVEIAYTGGNAKNLPTQWIFNQPTPSPVPVNIASPDPAANPWLRRPFRNISIGSFVVTNILQSTYNAMTVKVDKRFSKGFGFLTTYTWSKSIDEGSEVFQLANTFGIISNNRNIRQDRGVSTFDLTHRWVTSGIVELPFGKGKPWLNGSGWMDKVFGGFQVSGIFTVQSGFPFTPLVRNRLANTGYALSTERGDLVGNPYWPGDEWKRRVKEWEAGNGRLYIINPASININYAPGTFGNIARNFFRAPYGRNLDISAAKRIQLGEQVNLVFRADFIGVTNERLHRMDLVSFVCANVCLTNPLVGSIPDRKFLFNPRLMQLGLKLTF